MRCKNCGANYKTRELKCPYCNTENLIGKIWQAERSQAEKDYENEKKNLGKAIFSPYMLNRFANRSLVLVLGIYAVSIIIITVILLIYDVWGPLYFSLHKEEIEKQMEEYYSAGEYEKLDLYMEENYVKLRDYYAYTQATLMVEDYDSYLECRLRFENLSEEEKLKDEYCLEYAVDNSWEVYALDCGSYSRLDERNKELHEYYQKEIMAYWIGCLKLSEEEIAELTNDDYLSYDTRTKIIESIKERRSWQ